MSVRRLGGRRKTYEICKFFSLHFCVKRGKSGLKIVFLACAQFEWPLSITVCLRIIMLRLLFMSNVSLFRPAEVDGVKDTAVYLSTSGTTNVGKG